MIEAADVADFRDEADGGHERHAMERLQRIDDRGRPAPGGRELSHLISQTLDPSLRLVDRVARLLQRDVLRRQRDTEIREPPPIRLRPTGAPG